MSRHSACACSLRVLPTRCCWRQRSLTRRCSRGKVTLRPHPSQPQISPISSNHSSLFHTPRHQLALVRSISCTSPHVYCPGMPRVPHAFALSLFPARLVVSLLSVPAPASPSLYVSLSVPASPSPSVYLPVPASLHVCIRARVSTTSRAETRRLPQHTHLPLLLETSA